MTHQHATLEDTIYFWFASNDTSGSGNDGAAPAAHVRLAGALATAAPVLSPTPSLLNNAAYPAGCYEVAVEATAANGFAANNTYAVFCTLAVDSQNPTGHIGSVTLSPMIADVRRVLDDPNAVKVGASGLQEVEIGTVADAAIPETAFITGAVSNRVIAAGAITASEAPNLDAAVSSRSVFDHTSDQVVASNMRGTDNASTHSAADVAAAIGTRQVPDGVAAKGAQPTYDEALNMLHNDVGEFEIIDNLDGSSRREIRKPDGTTTSATFTLNGDATTPPTKSERAT